MGDCEKGKEFNAKGKYTLNLKDIVTSSYIETLKNRNTIASNEKERAEKTLNSFDAIRQPYVMIAIISEILKRANIDLTKYYREKILYNTIQKNWLKEISFKINDIYNEKRETGDNIINYYKSKNLVEDFKEYLDLQHSRYDRTVKDLFIFTENIE